MSKNPELPGAQAEARLVADLFKSNGYISAPLIRPTALEALTRLFDPDCRVLHVAAHGNYDSAQPDNSGSFLAGTSFSQPVKYRNFRCCPSLSSSTAATSRAWTSSLPRSSPRSSRPVFPSASSSAV